MTQTPTHSFDIKSSKDFFEKVVLGNYNDYLENDLSARHAINVAISAWHLIDWIFSEQNKEKANSFKKAHIKACPELALLQDITNGSKHAILSNKNPNVQNTSYHKGDFSNDFSFDDFDTDALEIIKSDGSKLYFRYVIKDVIVYWEKYFSQFK